MFWKTNKKMLEQKDEIIEWYKKTMNDCKDELRQINERLDRYREQETDYKKELEELHRTLEEYQTKEKQMEKKVEVQRHPRQKPRWGEPSTGSRRPVPFHELLANYQPQQQPGQHPHPQPGYVQQAGTGRSSVGFQGQYRSSGSSPVSRGSSGGYRSGHTGSRTQPTSQGQQYLRRYRSSTMTTINPFG
ncbi:hypothetical protein C8P63_10996 [Melghirimyces profundicolus]|uniref:Uncharacterized protein n=1 Tax=Melghirimyces profundicolus TaxID=1242148 RepID=A0A2T6BW83_9BACL|nr:hypothetical protein [Melghirimyces profundicolus]PTX60331.1 hypothetical protein C8P63_10996 [Melghirimyces profundicolus]